MSASNPVANLQALIRCPSVTPAEGGALSALEAMLSPLGFQVERMVATEPGMPDIENLYARLGTDGPHLMFAGHTDVVPPGDESSWSHPPFAAEIVGDTLYGRGAVDMKGGIACFVAAVARHIEQHGAPKGSISFLITGDEEGPAVNGTDKLLKWAAEKGERWDACVVGEPTNPDVLGDMIKIGRRGSVSGKVTVHGVQGHAAYPHLADSPVRGLLPLASALMHPPFDGGTPEFPASNLEVQCHSGQGCIRFQHPVQRHLDGRHGEGGNPAPPECRSSRQPAAARTRAHPLRDRLGRAPEPRVPDP